MCDILEGINKKIMFGYAASINWSQEKGYFFAPYRILSFVHIWMIKTRERES